MAFNFKIPKFLSDFGLMNASASVDIAAAPFQEFEIAEVGASEPFEGVRGIWAADNDIIDFEDSEGNVISGFPIFKGPNPISISKLTTASVTIWLGR